MAVHIEHMTSTVDVTSGGSPLAAETLSQIVEAVAAELARRQARAERAERDRAVAGGGHSGGCGCGR